MIHCHFLLTLTGCWNYLHHWEVNLVGFDSKKVPSVLDLRVTFSVQVGSVWDDSRPRQQNRIS